MDIINLFIAMNNEQLDKFFRIIYENEHRRKESLKWTKGMENIYSLRDIVYATAITYATQKTSQKAPKQSKILPGNRIRFARNAKKLRFARRI